MQLYKYAPPENKSSRLDVSNQIIMIIETEAQGSSPLGGAQPLHPNTGMLWIIFNKNTRNTVLWCPSTVYSRRNIYFLQIAKISLINNQFRMDLV